MSRAGNEIKKSPAVELPLKIVIDGVPVPKGNASTRSRASAMKLHQRYKRYRDDACFAIRKQVEPKPWRPVLSKNLHAVALEPYTGEVLVELDWWRPDATKRDLDNGLKPVGDVLQASGLLDDDFQIKRWLATDRGVDRKRPRVELEIRAWTAEEGKRD